MKAVFDTNILIDYLNGINEADVELNLYAERSISIISYMEVLVGVESPEEEVLVRRFLSTFKIIALTESVAESSVLLRKEKGFKLPDAIVYASAKTEKCLLVSRNTKYFKQYWPDVRVPYTL